MEPYELLRFVAEALERLGIEYLITGSTASIAYGEARMTNDIDIVIRLPIERVEPFCAAFPADAFYVSDVAARDAVRRCGQFNVIHPGSGMKIDFVVASGDAFNESRFARGRRLNVPPDSSALFAAPEDVILRKLEYYRAGGSDKHLRDIRGILKVTGESIDREYLARWIERLEVEAEWDEACKPLN